MFELQARLVAKAMVDRISPLYFTLPDQVVCKVAGTGEWVALTLPQDQREQKIGGLMDILEYSELRQRLLELEASFEQAISTSARLLRHAIAMHMAHTMLPVARRDEVHEPFTSWAGRIIRPQWVAFDDEGRLLVGSVEEAEAHLASMQRYLFVLHAAVALTPYIVADEEYGRKRYGMLGQLVNQGRALARYPSGQVVDTIRHRAGAGELNRGLSLTLPFFDDQQLEMRRFHFEVIPAGRIMFVPAFVVRAVREEQGKIAQDTRLSPSTRKYLLSQLELLEAAFDTSAPRS